MYPSLQVVPAIFVALHLGRQSLSVPFDYLEIFTRWSQETFDPFVSQ